MGLEKVGLGDIDIDPKSITEATNEAVKNNPETVISQFSFVSEDDDVGEMIGELVNHIAVNSILSFSSESNMKEFAVDYSQGKLHGRVNDQLMIVEPTSDNNVESVDDVSIKSVGGGNTTYKGETKPSNPVIGDKWIDENYRNDPAIKTYVGDRWMVTTQGDDLPASPITLSSPSDFTKKVDTSLMGSDIVVYVKSTKGGDTNVSGGGYYYGAKGVQVEASIPLESINQLQCKYHQGSETSDPNETYGASGGDGVSIRDGSNNVLLAAGGGGGAGAGDGETRGQNGGGPGGGRGGKRYDSPESGSVVKAANVSLTTEKSEANGLYVELFRSQ